MGKKHFIEVGDQRFNVDYIVSARRISPDRVELRTVGSHLIFDDEEARSLWKALERHLPCVNVVDCRSPIPEGATGAVLADR